MKSITPSDFGNICGYVAYGLSKGQSPDQATETVINYFRQFDLDPVDVADIAEGVIEQWQRLQVRGPLSDEELKALEKTE